MTKQQQENLESLRSVGSLVVVRKGWRRWGKKVSHPSRTNKQPGFNYECLQGLYRLGLVTYETKWVKPETWFDQKNGLKSYEYQEIWTVVA